MTDVLVVSLGTTPGLRVADSLLMSMLHEAGASAEAISVRRGVTDALRRGYPVNDFVEAVAARRALAGALAARARPRGALGSRGRPGAVLFSTTTAALLARTGGLPYAVRLDSPAALNRPGALSAPVRGLERRSLARARLIVPVGAAGAAALPPGSARAEVVPVPIEPSGDISRPRDLELAVGYAADRAKGLDLLCAAWAQVAGGDRRLEVFGIERDAALAFLARRGVSEPPPGVTFRGTVSTAEFRSALRRARCLVSGARWEDFGQAPLEALRDGALLVTTPAGGPYEALAIARELDRDLVAADLEPASLAAAIRAAYTRDDHARAAYQARAAARLEPYRRHAAVQTLRERVLPVLLDRPR